MKTSIKKDLQTLLNKIPPQNTQKFLTDLFKLVEFAQLGDYNDRELRLQ